MRRLSDALLAVGLAALARPAAAQWPSFDQVESLQYGAAARTAGLLLGISFVFLTVVYALQRTAFFRWHDH